METAPLEGLGNTPKRKSQWRLSLLLVFGTLFLLAVVILPVTLFIYFVPPLREQGAAALDEDDFGLGFRVGDAWNPDAIIGAIKARGINVQLVPIEEPRHTEWIEWSSPEKMLYISTSKDYHNKGYVYRVSIDCGIVKTPITVRMAKEAKKQYPSDKHARFADFLRRLHDYLAEQHPQIKATSGIRLCSSAEDMLKAYGRPSYTWPEIRDKEKDYEYLGYKQQVTIRTSHGRIIGFVFSPGYNSYDFSQRADAWMRSISQPFINPSIKRILEQSYDDGAAKPKGEKGINDDKG